MKNRDLEKELEDLEARFKSIFMGSPIAITLYDSEGKLLDANKACLDLINITDVADIRGFDILDDPNMPSDVKERLEKGEIVKFEFIYDFDKVKDILRAERSGVLYFDAIISPIYLSNKEYIGYYLVQVRDITERKKLEDGLYHEQDLIRTLLENHPDFIYFKDSKARFQHISKSLCEFFGSSREDIIGKTDLELFPEKVAKQTHNEDLHVINTGIPLINKEENTAGVWVLMTKIPWFDKKGNKKGLFGISHNITELKKAEIALRESESKYRSLFDNMNAGFAYHEIILDENNKPIDYRFLEANPAFEKFTGLKVDEIIGKTATEVLPGIENDPADWIGRFGKVALTGAPLSFEDYSEAINKWYNVSSYSPKKGYFAVTFTDITELKRVQQVLKESEEKLRKSNIKLEQKVEARTKELKESETKYRALFEQAGDSIILIDTETGDIVDFNDKMYENLGYTRDEFKNLKIPDFDIMESTEDYSSHIEKVIREGSDTFETEYLTKNDEVRNMMVSARAIKINDKNYLHSIIRDITDQKLAEENLTEAYSQANLYKDLFAHDINNILQNILSASEICTLFLDKQD